MSILRCIGASSCFSSVLLREITFVTFCMLLWSRNPLKVGSCPNDDNFVQIFWPFLYSNKMIFFLNAFLPRIPQDFADNPCFFRLFIPLVLEFRF